eukprot:6089912-Pyramimonas_sp.AAC.1
MHTGLTDPLSQRPLIEGLPWRDFLPWSDTIDLAKAAGITKDDMEHMLRGLDPGNQHKDERHRFLLVDNPSLEVTSRLHAGCANLPEAAQTVDIVRAL